MASVLLEDGGLESCTQSDCADTMLCFTRRSHRDTGSLIPVFINTVESETNNNHTLSVVTNSLIPVFINTVESEINNNHTLFCVTNSLIPVFINTVESEINNNHTLSVLLIV